MLDDNYPKFLITGYKGFSRNINYCYKIHKKKKTFGVSFQRDFLLNY